MSQSYISLFDEKDVIEENRLQTILTGSKKNAPDQLVLINKFKKVAHFDVVFKELLENALQQKLHIEDNEEEIILVTKEIDGENLNLFLNFTNVSEEKRFDYLYEYLHQTIAYIGFDNYLINILIGQNQVVFNNEQLYLKESIFIDRRIDEDMPFSMVAKKVGNTMNKILTTNFNEHKASEKHEKLKEFSNKLIRRDNNYVCLDDIFTAFKQIYFNQKDSHNGVLIGEMHPNNMLLDTSIDDEIVSAELTPNKFSPKETEIYEENPESQVQTINREVTNEERELLTGLLQGNSEAITGPTEESIDLSKLSSDTASFNELIVNEREDVTYGVPDSLKDKSFINQNTVSEDEEHNDKQSKKRKPLNLKIPIIASIIALIILLSIMIIPKLFNNTVEEPQRPNALFVIELEGNKLFCENLSKAYNNEHIVESYWKIERDNVELDENTGASKADFDVSGLTEGVYKITLIVTDSKGRHSEPYTLEKQYQSPESKALENQASTESNITSDQNYETSDVSTEPLDNFTLSATVNVSEDYTIQHTGNRSIKADLTENNGIASLSFNNVQLQKKATVSFWLMSNKKESIKIQLTGYDGDINVFSKEIIYSPTSILSWNIFSTQVEISGTSISADKLVIRLTSDGAAIWLDDLSIKSFK